MRHMGAEAGYLSKRNFFRTHASTVLTRKLSQYPTFTASQAVLLLKGVRRSMEQPRSCKQTV